MNENVEKRRFPWFRVIISLVLVGLVLMYEKNANEVLSYAEEVNSAGPEIAVLTYQVVIEKYPLSFASVKAKEQLALIELEKGVIPSGRIEISFLEEYFDWLNPYVYYGFPFFACLSCLGILAVSFVLRLFFCRPIVGVVVLAIVAGVLFALQLIVSGAWSGPSFVSMELVFEVMGEPRWLFWVCYLLVPISMLVALTSCKREKVVVVV